MDGAPDPRTAVDLADFVRLLGLLRLWAGAPPYRELAKRVGPLLHPPRVVTHSTITYAFRPGRRRLDLDLVVAVVRALGVDAAGVAAWRAACIAAHAEAKTGGAVGVFRQLPADLATFTGRSHELATLIEAATAVPPGDGARTVVVSAIEGMAGVGKTQLAVHAAHRLVRADRYGAVQLFVNLRGFDPEEPPADPAAVLESFLRQLQVPSEQIPHSRAERAAMFRDRMHGLDALIVLDNAADEAQVRDLIPASPRCLVLITSRRTLAALDGALLCSLDTFSVPEAVALLSRIAGDERVAAEPDQAEIIVELCGRLPLAVALAAARLRSRPAWSLAELAQRLSSGGLEAMAVGGRRVRSVLDMSYQGLPPPEQRLFRVLSLHSGHEFSAPSVAALAGISVAEAERHLEILLDEHLLQQRRSNRFEFHDLLRAYALERTHAEDRDDDRSQAVEGLAVWYLHAAHLAARTLVPQLPFRPLYGEAPAEPATFESYEAALAWSGVERPAMMAAVRQAGDYGMHPIAWRLALCLNTPFNLNKRYGDWIATLEAGLASARSAAESDGEALILNNLGTAYLGSGRIVQAVDCLENLLATAWAVDSDHNQMIVLTNLGMARNRAGQADAAVAALEQALERSVRLGHVYGQGLILGNLALVHKEHGRWDVAFDYASRSRETSRTSLNPRAEALALVHMSETTRLLGDPAEALGYARLAFDITGGLGDRSVRADACLQAGYTLLELGRPDEARTYLAEAIDYLDDTGDHRAAEARSRAGDGPPA